MPITPGIRSEKFKKYVYLMAKGFQNRDIEKKLNVKRITSYMYRRILRRMSHIEFEILLRNVAHEVEI